MVRFLKEFVNRESTMKNNLSVCSLLHGKKERSQGVGFFRGYNDETKNGRGSVHGS